MIRIFYCIQNLLKSMHRSYPTHDHLFFLSIAGSSLPQAFEVVSQHIPYTRFKATISSSFQVHVQV